MAIFILLRRTGLRKLFLILVVVFLLLLFMNRVGKGIIPTVAEPIYHGDDDKNVIALTCNVFWGEEYIGPMLEILTDKDVQVTFFIGGTWAERFPGLVREIQRRGHEIGSHGYSHPHPDRISREANLKDITKAQDILENITGKKPTLFAPPYGERGTVVLQTAEELGYQTILWSIDTIDWQRPGPQIIRDRVSSKAHNGGIVLMHPTASTVEALPGIIDDLRGQGYELITIGDMFQEEPNNN
ncbi:MAG: polysaccharide deacetylase [Peptococcaceae bacterium BRH_c8a]|nr:MAG: polysaccharide deacetylase [Peptococcaceae bacterium BRH_c8a]